MTFKERLAIEHPENVSDKYAGGCHGCPKDYGYSEDHSSTCRNYGKEGCDNCWNREIPEERKDDMKKEFTKSDLKDGMIIQFRNGEKMLWLYGNPVGIDMFFDKPNEDLTNMLFEDLDVVKVGYPNKSAKTIRNMLVMDFGEVIWERKENPVEMDVPVKEIVAMLKEKYPDVENFNILIEEK